MNTVDRPVSKSGNSSNHVTAKSIAVSSNVSEIVKRLYQCKPGEAVCSSNVSKPNACNVSSVSKLVEPLTFNKPVCSTFVRNSNISNVINVSQHVKPLNVNKYMSSCNVSNPDVYIVASVSHHVKPLSAGKSNCSCKVSKPVVRESVVMNLSKRAHKRSFNISMVLQMSLNVRSILMMFI